MDSNDKTAMSIIFGILVFAILLVVFSPAIEKAFGQQPAPIQQTQQQPLQPQQQPIIDPSTAVVGGTAGAGVLIAIVKQVLDQRKNKEVDKSTDRDVGLFVILMSKFYQAKYLYPNMTDKQILDLPISNNPMSSKTLGQAITEEADAWAQFNQQYWNIPQPQMSVPSATTVAAVSSAKVEGNTSQTAPPSAAAAPPAVKPDAKT